MLKLRLVSSTTTIAQTEGVLLDPVYTGKAFYGLCQELAAGRLGGAEDIVFVHTGGGLGLLPLPSNGLVV